MTDKVYVIAEAGVNHDGSLDDALRLVDAAAAAGADCVKFQIFSATALASVHADKAQYQKQTTQPQQNQLEMLKGLELPRAAFHTLQAHAQGRGIDFLATPFDPASLQFLLHDLHARRVKIGSGDLTNAPMLLTIGHARRDAILSTGMATLDEIEQALAVLAFGYAGRSEPPSRSTIIAALRDGATRATLTDTVTLLHCVTDYPAAAETVNLKAMDTLAEKFGLPVGFSDHTLGIEISVAAVARGAKIIEKHLTLDTRRKGPDHAASLEPGAFRRMVDGIRLVETALGDGCKRPQPAEIANIPIARKSLVAARSIAAGEVFSADNLALKRPATGLPPIAYWDLLGKPSSRAYQPDEIIDP